MSVQYQVVHYTENGKDIFQEWRISLRDNIGKIAIDRALLRVEEGNFGVHRFCRDGVWELVINTGPGYRVCYAMIEDIVMLLLCAGNKQTQERDINRAVAYLKKYKESNK